MQNSIIIASTINADAELVTHAGVFHADEVMATVILANYLDGAAKVLRTFDVTKSKFACDAIIYDIGLGKYDHHQRGGNGERLNGVPYASAGLIWRDFGRSVIGKLYPTLAEDEVKSVWRFVDNVLIAGIDANDNGVLPNVDYPVQVMSLSQCVSAFNPGWDSYKSANDAFQKACDFVSTVFENTLERAVSELRAKRIVEEAIAKSGDHIMVLSQFVPWQSNIHHSKMPEKASDIWFVVYPSNRGGFNWQVVPVGSGDRTARKSVPKEWRGLTNEKLREVSDVATAIFCHQAGFIGSAETLEDAILMARKAVEA